MNIPEHSSTRRFRSRRSRRALGHARWRLLEASIEGVKVRYQRPIEDARGEVTEVYRPSWGLNDDPLVYVYQVSVRPGTIKGWVVHELQEDPLFHITGRRAGRCTTIARIRRRKGLLNELVLSEKNRALMIIPRGVYHAVQNIGISDAIFVNMPTRPYDHGDPDKFRLPLNTPLIPFSFATTRGDDAADDGVRRPARARPGCARPLISVIVATYNSRATLACALDSVRRQDFQNFDVWVVGDACTDGSHEVVEALGDPRFHWINRETNSGTQSAPNADGLLRRAAATSRISVTTICGSRGIFLRWSPRSSATRRRSRTGSVCCWGPTIGCWLPVRRCAACRTRVISWRRRTGCTGAICSIPRAPSAAGGGPRRTRLRGRLGRALAHRGQRRDHHGGAAADDDQVSVAVVEALRSRLAASAARDA